MKKSIIGLIIALGVMMMAVLAVAENNEMEHFYNDYITKKISDCNKAASVYGSNYNTRMLEMSRFRVSQAEFYRQNQSKLVKIMLKGKLGKNLGKIDYFLICQHKNGIQNMFSSLETR